MFHRLCKPLLSNSFFLFGARGTGKTSLLRETFEDKETLWIDLLNAGDEEQYQFDPDILAQNLAVATKRPEWVVIDEVQRAPKLLDVVHRVIEEPWNRAKNVKFALTGSSARKLKRGAANLLAGRAYTYHLHPLTHCELGDQFDLMSVLTWGSLPTICNVNTDEERKAYLRSYTATYLKEEIAQEQLVRNIIPFRKFLPIASQCNGTILNYNSIARELGVDWTTVRNYFEILEDTLVGFRLPAFSRSIRKQQISSPKFYLFDVGVKRALDKTLNIGLETNQIIGPLFEQFIIAEAFRLNDYGEKDFSFSYLTTQGGAEIDLIVERPGEKTLFVEIKSSERVTSEQLRHLRDLSTGNDEIEPICICREPRARRDGTILILPWQDAFREIGLVDDIGRR
jgi:predicted AAA+ superfamily ATPase